MRHVWSGGPLLAALAFVAPSAAAADGKVEYNRDVRPILAENCFACHGTDAAARKADLRLDSRADALDSAAFVPGKPDESSLIERILLPADDDGLMPPAKSHKTLTAEQKATLKRWVAQGAEYQGHWAFLAPTRPATPAVQNAGWARNPIDPFVLAAMEKAGLAPAPEADRRTLARRLSLDLIGLPPAPAEVERFVNDRSPDYYERYVDHLMQSPHWGEHRGRYWLDAARFADTHGIHFDNYREMWSYRDWVIDAFNRNLPFDQFTLEQIAGDLLPNPTLDQKVASGFNRCNITTNEGGIIDEEYAVLYARDRTEAVSQVWMALTTGCAVCHDHKYDPVSQKDFYRLSAFFNNFAQPVRDGNVPNSPPIIPLPRAEERERFAQLDGELAAQRAKLAARKTEARGDFNKWLTSARAAEVADALPTQGMTFHAPLHEGKGKQVTVTVAGAERPVKLPGLIGWVDAAKTKRAGVRLQPGAAAEFADAGDFSTMEPFSVAAWVLLQKRNQTGAIVARMDPGAEHRGWDLYLQGDKLTAHIISAWDGDALKVVAKTALPFNEWKHVAMSYDGSGKATGVKLYVNGEVQPVDVENDRLKTNSRATVPLKFGQRHTGISLQNVGLADVRLYNRALPALDAKALAGNGRVAELLAKGGRKPAPAAFGAVAGAPAGTVARQAAGPRTPAETDELYDWWAGNFDGPSRALGEALSKLQAEDAAIRGRGTIAFISVEKPTPPEAFVLNRGEYDQRREKVGPATPAALPPMPADLPPNRLGLAKWLLRPEQPLTARVTVNRFWQELFGQGLVRTAGDFGVSGELPSHPELLDFLAVEFRETGWDVRRFFRLLVTSAAYRQAAVTTPEKLERDPQNRLLSRGPRFRMDAEMVRDYALAVSGLMVPKVGGPSVKTYQPDGVWEAVAMIGSNTRTYKRDAGENLYRRSLYTFWKRSAPPAFLDVMNAPNRESCTLRRDRTNTPLQALLTLNDVQYVEAARALAEKAMQSGEADDARIDFLARRLLSRPFAAEELAVVRGTLAELAAHYAADVEGAKKLIAFGESKPDAKLDPAALAAWAMLANELMNLDEVLNK